MIQVWHCRGRYGWTIPWAEWQALTTPVTPVNFIKDPDKYIYLYSLRGNPSEIQDGLDPEKTPGLQLWEGMSLCIDDYIKEEGYVDWALVYEKLKKIWTDSTPQNLKSWVVPYDGELIFVTADSISVAREKIWVDHGIRLPTTTKFIQLVTTSRYSKKLVVNLNG